MTLRVGPELCPARRDADERVGPLFPPGGTRTGVAFSCWSARCGGVVPMNVGLIRRGQMYRCSLRQDVVGGCLRPVRTPSEQPGYRWAFRRAGGGDATGPTPACAPGRSSPRTSCASRSARAGTPLLHDHVPVSLRGPRPDGKWGAVHSTTLLENVVAASSLCGREIHPCRQRPEHEYVTAVDEDGNLEFGPVVSEEARTKLSRIAVRMTRPPKPRARTLAQLRAGWRASAKEFPGRPPISSTRCRSGPGPRPQRSAPVSPRPWTSPWRPSTAARWCS